VPAHDPTNPLERMRRLLGARFEELAGARVQGEVPVTDAVLNRLIAERLRASETPVEKAEVQVRANEELFVRVQLRRSYLPAVIVGARVEQQPDLPRSAVLGLRWWLPGMGALAALAAPALSFLKGGPPWLTVDGHHLRIDLARLLRDHGAEEILAHLASLRVGTRDGALLVRFELQVAGPRTESGVLREPAER
jgi:hypothetical protein